MAAEQSDWTKATFENLSQIEAWVAYHPGKAPEEAQRLVEKVYEAYEGILVTGGSALPFLDSYRGYTFALMQWHQYCRDHRDELLRLAREGDFVKEERL